VFYRVAIPSEDAETIYFGVFVSTYARRFTCTVKITNEVYQHKMKPKEKPNTSKKANTDSAKLPLPVVTQLY
jgi:hypothetical protein